MLCKVMKKSVLGVVAGAGLLALLFGSAAPSYLKTVYHRARHSAHDAVPVQFEIDRARQLVNELEPELHRNIETIARAEVEIEHLDREIAATRENLDREGKALMALREHLSTGDVKLTGGVSYSPEEVKAEMARRLEHYKTIKGILADKETTLQLRKKALLAAREQNTKMKASKMILMTQIEGIETRLRQIEATQAANEFDFDDSALARAKQTVAELNKRVEVIARVTEQEGRYSGSALPMILEPGRDIVKEVDAEFGNSQDADDHHSSTEKDL